MNRSRVDAHFVGAGVKHSANIADRPDTTTDR